MFDDCESDDEDSIFDRHCFNNSPQGSVDSDELRRHLEETCDTPKEVSKQVPKPTAPFKMFSRKLYP